MSRNCQINLHPAVAALQVAPPFLWNNHLVLGVEIPEVALHVPPILCNTQSSSNKALELTTGTLYCFVRNTFEFVQQLLCNHSLLVYLVKGCQVAWEGACLQCGVVVGAGHAMRLPFLAHLIAKAHAMIGSGRELGPDPTGSAKHGLHLQVAGF
jgi:hypothetical protein